MSLPSLSILIFANASISVFVCCPPRGPARLNKPPESSARHTSLIPYFCAISDYAFRKAFRIAFRKAPKALPAIGDLKLISNGSGSDNRGGKGRRGRPRPSWRLITTVPCVFSLSQLPKAFGPQATSSPRWTRRTKMSKSLKSSTRKGTPRPRPQLWRPLSSTNRRAGIGASAATSGVSASTRSPLSGRSS